MPNFNTGIIYPSFCILPIPKTSPLKISTAESPHTPSSQPFRAQNPLSDPHRAPYADPPMVRSSKRSTVSPSLPQPGFIPLQGAVLSSERTTLLIGNRVYGHSSAEMSPTPADLKGNFGVRPIGRQASVAVLSEDRRRGIGMRRWVLRLGLDGLG